MRISFIYLYHLSGIDLAERPASAASRRSNAGGYEARCLCRANFPMLYELFNEQKAPILSCMNFRHSIIFADLSMKKRRRKVHHSRVSAGTMALSSQSSAQRCSSCRRMILCFIHPSIRMYNKINNRSYFLWRSLK